MGNGIRDASGSIFYDGVIHRKAWYDAGPCPPAAHGEAGDAFGLFPYFINPPDPLEQSSGSSMASPERPVGGLRARAGRDLAS